MGLRSPGPYLAGALTLLLGTLGASQLESRSEKPIYASNIKALEPGYVDMVTSMAGRPNTRYTIIKPGGGVRFGLQHDLWALNRPDHDMEISIENLFNLPPGSFEIIGIAKDVKNEVERSHRLFHSRSPMNGRIVYVYFPEGFKGMNEFELKNIGEDDIRVNYVKACDSTSEEIQISDRMMNPKFPSMVIGSDWIKNPEDAIGVSDGIPAEVSYGGYIILHWDMPFLNGNGDDLRVYGELLGIHGVHSYAVSAYRENRDGELGFEHLGRGGSFEGGFDSFDLGRLKKARMIRIDFLNQNEGFLRGYQHYFGEPPILKIDAVEAMYPGDT